MTESITYSDRRNIPRDQILALYLANTWSSANRPDELCMALANSATLISAWDGDRLVGLGNALTDGHWVVYFPHLLVHPDYHRRGIGTAIVNRLKNTYAGFHQQILVAEDHAIAFYESCGFNAMEDKTPMVASGGEPG